MPSINNLNGLNEENYGREGEFDKGKIDVENAEFDTYMSAALYDTQPVWCCS